MRRELSLRRRDIRTIRGAEIYPRQNRWMSRDRLSQLRGARGNGAAMFDNFEAPESIFAADFPYTEADEG
jgi:hypothetical protein